MQAQHISADVAFVLFVFVSFFIPFPRTHIEIHAVLLLSTMTKQAQGLSVYTYAYAHTAVTRKCIHNNTAIAYLVVPIFNRQGVSDRKPVTVHLKVSAAATTEDTKGIVKR